MILVFDLCTLVVHILKKRQIINKIDLTGQTAKLIESGPIALIFNYSV